jgi:hypothetical protein
MAEGKNIGIIISIAVALILGVVLIQIIAGSIANKTGLISVTDSFSIAPARTEAGGVNDTYTFDAQDILSKSASKDWRTNDASCKIAYIKFKNQSGATMVDPTGYVWVTDGSGTEGSLTLKNILALNSSDSNSTTITYSTCPDDYMSGWTGTITNLIPGFFALAILLAAVFVIYFVLKEEGVDF